MTGEQLLIAFGSADDALLELCENYRAPRRMPWKALAAAACFALALLAGAAALHRTRIPVTPEPAAPQTAAGETAPLNETQTGTGYEPDVSVIFPPLSQIPPTSEPAEIPPEAADTTAAWNVGAGVYERQDGKSGGDAVGSDEASAQETDALFRKAPITTKYPSLTWQGKTYMSRGNSDPSAKVQKTVLGTAELTGFDGVHKTTVKVLPVGGVSQAAAVAVQFADSDRYYTYVSTSFAPATLGAYADAFALWDNASFTRVSGCSRKYAATVYPAPAAQTLRDLFDRGAPLANADEDDCAQDMTIECSVPVLGVRGSAFGVSGTGYLFCRLTDSTVIYYIGAERAQAFLDAVDAGDATHLVATTAPRTE